MKKSLKILALATLITLPNFTMAKVENNSTTTKQVVNSVKENDAEYKQAVTKLLEQTGMKESFSKIIEQQTDVLVKRLPVLKSVKDDIKSFYSKYLSWDRIKEETIKIYKKYYTLEEIKELQKFYQTPVGKKTIKVLPSIMQESRMIGYNLVKSHGKELDDIISKAMKSQKEAQSTQTQTAK